MHLVYSQRIVTDMKSFKCFVMLLSAVLFAEASQFRCDYTYFPDGQGWFKLHEESLWSVADYRCKLEGAELASPSNDGVTDAMMSLIFEEDFIIAVHTGLEPAVESTRLLIEKEGIALTRNGTLKRISQSDYYPFICHKRAGESIELNECGTTDNDYQLDQRTNHCYKLHRTHASWHQALNTCAAEQSNLAVINSEEEAQAIRDLFAKYPPEVIEGDVWKDTAFLGFRRARYYFSFDSINADEWKTVDGLTLQQAGYEGFSLGEPNNAAGDEFCGSVGRNGKLFDDPCTSPLLFICEKEPESSCNLHLQLQKETKDKQRKNNSQRHRQYKYQYVLKSNSNEIDRFPTRR